mmetsp:Transcript_89270/g.148956  ORF Transcript_89270/g.148956 Transcript_89270/m.148956 type:complete len:228 (+) Transcript_89270:547-1230(+)
MTAGTAGQGSAACPVSTADAEAGCSRTSPSSCTCRKAPVGVGHALFVLSDDQLTRIFHSANNALCCASQIVCVCVCVCVSGHSASSSRTSACVPLFCNRVRRVLCVSGCLCVVCVVCVRACLCPQGVDRCHCAGPPQRLCLSSHFCGCAPQKGARPHGIVFHGLTGGIHVRAQCFVVSRVLACPHCVCVCVFVCVCVCLFVSCPVPCAAERRLLALDMLCLSCLMTN